MTAMTICSALAAVLYLAAGTAIVGALTRGDSKASSLVRLPILLGLVLQGWAIQGEMFRTDAVHFGFGFAVSVLFFFAVVILLVESFVHRLHGLFGIVLIASAFGAVFPILFPGQAIPASEWTPFFRCHLLLALCAYSFMTIALVQAVLMGVQNRALKAPGEESNFLSSLPGLVVMERIFFRIVLVGFLCLVLVLVTGSIASKEAHGVFIHLDHKMILTWLACALFGVLLAGRRFAGWRAKTALNWFWTGYGVLALAYLGYSFILEVL